VCGLCWVGVHCRIKHGRIQTIRKIATAAGILIALAVNIGQMLIWDFAQFIVTYIAPKIVRVSSVGDALHGVATRIIRVIGPSTLEGKGMRQRLGEVTFHGAGLCCQA